MKRKAQLAMEYVMITGFLIFLLLGIIYAYGQFTAQNKDMGTYSKSESVLYEIANAIDQVYLYGEGSKAVIEVNIPRGINSMSSEIFSGGSELAFSITNDMGEISEVVVVSEAGEINISTGFEQSPITNFISYGNKRILIENNGDNIGVSVIE
ncbi:hypothetical protein K8R47_00865 [archaeon]|nr:hypothetical protein [archaeon]